jgi:anaerobic magnesium-protoporphyrin IX monomethyl ester cyclase
MKPLDVLFIAPPQNGFYYNLCYNFTELGEVAAYAKKLECVGRLDISDESVRKIPDWDAIEKRLDGNYDAVVVWNRFENLHGMKRICELAKSVNPDAKVATYGQPSSIIPGHFTKGYMVDAVVSGIPWELSIGNYLEYLSGKRSSHDLSGLLANLGGAWTGTKSPTMPVYPYWEFADLGSLPLEEYFNVYDKEDRIAGIRGMKEIGISVSRGCPTGCMFCNVPKIHGRKDMRKSVSSVMEYFDRNSKKYGFNFVSLFSPIFTLDKRYAMDFSERMKWRGIGWKCVTHPNFVDDDIIGAMRDGGCLRIGFGIETMNPQAQNFVNKSASTQKVGQVIDACNRNSIQPLIFLMLGIPGETRDTFVSTVKFLDSKGAKIRVTGYTPFYNLNECMSIDEVSGYDRQLISANNVKGMSPEEFARVINDFDGWLKDLK